MYSSCPAQLTIIPQLLLLERHTRGTVSEYTAYDDLPVLTVNGKAKRCAWGVFDKDGRKDVYCCLNKVTPAVVARAAAEVTDGVSISLKYDLPLPIRSNNFFSPDDCLLGPSVLAPSLALGVGD
jgi:hypothetical protein